VNPWAIENRLIAAIDRARRRGPGPKRKKPLVEEEAAENRPASAPGRRRKRRVYEVMPPSKPKRSAVAAAEPLPLDGLDVLSRRLHDVIVAKYGLRAWFELPERER
jgi:hypothetical protein